MNEPKEEKQKSRQEIAMEEFNKILDELRVKNGCVLDVGCNNNKYQKPIEERGMHWIGLDPHQEKGVSIKARMEDIPIHNGIVTCIFCSHAFEHTVDPLQTLGEFKRVLKANGLLYLVCPFPTDQQIFGMDKTHWFVLYPKQLISLLHKSGFIVIKDMIIKDEEGYDNIIIAALSS